MARAGLSRGQSEEDATPGIAEAELAAGEWALAIQKLQASLSKRPENTDAWADLSLACLNRGGPQDLELALDAAERAIDLDPRCFAAWFNRACAHARLGHSQEALAALESAHALDAELVRTLAPQDPDLASVRDDPRFAALIGG